jgi:rhodanese-related sulfurtransferase
MTAALPIKSFQDVRQALLTRQEIALIDVREEDSFARGHPLFAANFPAGRIELDAWSRIPRRATPLVVYDDGEGLAEPAARTLQQLGYTDVALLNGGLQGWRSAGGEIFKDVNVPSKALGNWSNQSATRRPCPPKKSKRCWTAKPTWWCWTLGASTSTRP